MMKSENESTIKFLPKWVWAIAFIQIGLVLFFSAGTAMNPGNFLPDISHLNYVTMLYVTRNITVALGIIISLLLRSHKALLTILCVRILTDLSDIASVFILDVEVIKSSVPMVIILLVFPASLAIRYLLKRI